MANAKAKPNSRSPIPNDVDPAETAEWLESLDYVLESKGPERVQQLLAALEEAADPQRRRAAVHGDHAVRQHDPAPTSSRAYPGNRELERRIKSFVRWNAMAMVTRANRDPAGIGGHISHLCLVGHAVRSRLQPLLPRPRRERLRRRPDLLPRSRLARHVLARVSRRPTHRTESGQLPPRAEPKAAGCRRYPHPWLMPDFWEFPTVSMGLGPIMAIYQARFNRYLTDRGINDLLEEARLGLPGRRRMRRARNARRDHAGLARAARQPDLRHQLQPAAARWPGARQRQDHSRARRRVPRCRLERHQSRLGRRLGSAAGERRDGPLAAADDGSRRRPVSEVRRLPAAITFASTSSASIPSCWRW